MPVEFTCDGCNRRLRAPDAKAGKRTNCPTCGKELQIPVMGIPTAIHLPTAGAPIAHPLDQLASAIPTAAEAAAAFQLSKPATSAPATPTPATPTPATPTPATSTPRPSSPVEIGLALDDDVKTDEVKALAPRAPSSSGTASAMSGSSSGIGGVSKSKQNAWRGGEKSPSQMPAAKPAAPETPKQAPSKPGAARPTIPAAPNPFGIDIPAKPTASPATPTPSPLIPVASAANPLDDIFKDIPQLAPVSSPAPMGGGAVFGGLRPVTTTDPFASSGAALPQASAPRWDQVASSAKVSSNPYASPNYGGGGGGFGRSANIDAVRTMVMIPGIFLLICYIFLFMGFTLRIGLTAIGLVVIGSDPAVREQVTLETGGVGIAMEVMLAILFFVLSIAGLFGAIKMIKIRSRSAAMTAAVMAIFPFCLCCPFGIWAVVVLSQENVQRAFDANDRRHGG